MSQNSSVKIAKTPNLVLLPSGNLGMVYVPDNGKHTIHWAKKVSENTWVDMGPIANGTSKSNDDVATTITFQKKLYVFYQGTTDDQLCWATLEANMEWADHGPMRTPSITYLSYSDVSPLIFQDRLYLAYRSREQTLKGVVTVDGKTWTDLGELNVESEARR